MIIYPVTTDDETTAGGHMTLFQELLRRIESEAGVVSRSSQSAEETRSEDRIANIFVGSSVVMFGYGLTVLGGLLTEDCLLPDEKRQAVALARKLAATYPANRKIQEVAGGIITKHGEKAEVTGTKK